MKQCLFLISLLCPLSSIGMQAPLAPTPPTDQTDNEPPQPQTMEGNSRQVVYIRQRFNDTTLKSHKKPSTVKTICCLCCCITCLCCFRLCKRNDEEGSGIDKDKP